MTDLRDLLHATAAEGSQTVDLAEEAVVARIRHRRTRNRHFTVGAVGVATAAVIAGTTLIIREQPPTATAPAPRIVTSDVDNPSVLEALLQTTLTADANGCVRAGSTDTTLVWPRGYTVRGNNKSFEIVDPANNVVARSGVPLDIGGGGLDRLQSTWAGLDCAGDGPVWWVGSVASR